MIAFLIIAIVGTVIGVVASQAGKVQIVEVPSEPVVTELEPLDCETGQVYNKENHVCVKECPEFAYYDFTLEDCTYPYNN